MPGFADSFWSPDYASGLGVLYGKLQQGIAENQQIVTIARMRADAEEQYSNKLAEIAPAVDRITNGFTRDDGASVRKVGPRHCLGTGRWHGRWLMNVDDRPTRVFAAR